MRYEVEPHPTVRNTWWVVVVDPQGARMPLTGSRYRKRVNADRRAYELTVAYERRQNRIVYLGD